MRVDVDIVVFVLSGIFFRGWFFFDVFCVVLRDKGSRGVEYTFYLELGVLELDSRW